MIWFMFYRGQTGAFDDVFTHSDLKIVFTVFFNLLSLKSKRGNAAAVPGQGVNEIAGNSILHI